MRSSPSFLAVSRSEEEARAGSTDRREESRKSSRITRPLRQMDELNSLEVHLKVGYKTVLLVVVLADLIHTSLQEVVDVGIIQQLLGN